MDLNTSFHDAGSGEGSSSDDESSDDPSSSSSCNEELLRNAWDEELGKPGGTSYFPREFTQEEKEIELRARNLFLLGARAEQRGLLYEAIRFYRRAVQLVPDIEMKISANMARHKDPEHGPRKRTRSETEQVELTVINDLLARIHLLTNRNIPICQPELEQKASHISILPAELIMYIFKWVVSSDLDLRSLEQLGQVCRGFYLCSRDSELWRLACIRVWGDNCGSPNKYGSWRNMYIERPRLHYNGCYISKTTYFRAGENSFQDDLYRPWHIVEYFRYLRFFPDGTILMLTTPDEPRSSLVHLRRKVGTKHPAILRGHYRLSGDVVTAVLQRPHNEYGYQQRTRKGRPLIMEQDSKQTFHMELEIRTFKRKRHYQLVWRRYAAHTIYRNGQETIAEFDLNVQNKFPPFWFSRVKSYCDEAEFPLA